MASHRACYRTAVTSNPYIGFLPAGRRRAAELEPESEWWPWREHRVHIARARRMDAPARVLVVHGAGGHSGALWPLAAQLAECGLDIAAIDLPLYGRTTSPHPNRVRYEHWVELLTDLVEAEHDERPLILLGASIGGMLAYQVASQSSRVAAVVATCLLNPRDWRARAHMARFSVLGILGGPLAFLAHGPISSLMVPMGWMANLSRMSHNPDLSRLCASDPHGGGAKVPLGFLASFLRYHHTPPETMTTPVILAHPGRDAWTPMELSMKLFRDIASADKAIVLDGCGHFPVEEPGLSTLVSAVLDLT